MTYRELVTGVISSLRGSSEAISLDTDHIYYVRPGQMDMEPPFLLVDVTVQPGKSENESVAQAIVTLFSGANNANDAQESSIECHERLIVAVNVLKLSSCRPRHIKTIQSDGQYPGFAVSFVELEYLISLTGS